MSTLEENLFQPLNPETRAEFTAGAGDELGSEDKPGKMQVPWSSSALVCNVFDYWRNQLNLGKSVDTLTTALGLPAPVRQIRFEQVYPTGLRGISPHLDVVLEADGSKPFLIESKFTEAYNPQSSTIIGSYFPDSGELWGKHGLPRCEDLARRIHADQEEFRHVNAPQLLKHILGIANGFQKNFTLLYLWYDHPVDGYSSFGAAEHRAEIETFMLRLNGEIDFRAMTYQDLFKKMLTAPAVDGSYIAYLAERYFPG